ncbi:cytidine/deoxycytidylate deaminase family protein [Lojkania enalia]|uniref:Cytidine/deoxycytidylate deaminase family protein n=1 Tax=Lojkania enalia TaxID=147567 RepID=A0A9P4K4N6_9PLEO|nr:cytidine/deoxycytidylate deaminase family protein [Didymosphaeria enalia]
MASPQQDPIPLLQALLSTIEHKIVPLTAQGVSSGSKLFGAAIISKSMLNPIIVATNNERVSPLLHGEINCIQQFFLQDSATRPSTSDCIFLATHEPCSLCLSGITWSGFDNFYYLFTYEDSRDLFSIPYDIQILEQVFRVRAKEESDEELQKRELYNRRNKFFTAQSFAELVVRIEDEGERKKWGKEVERVKSLYGRLSDRYQKGKDEGVKSESFWK